MATRYKILLGFGLLLAVAVIVAALNAGEESQGPSASNQVYQSKDYGFSLEYPADLNTSEFYDNPDGDIIVFQNGSTGFQIFITSYDGGLITRDTILKDLPSTTVEDPKEVIIGDGIRALIFWSDSPKIGKTREVWFTRDGYLYEVSTYARLDTWLANIMKSWKFN